MRNDTSELLTANERDRLYRWARDMTPEVVLVCAQAPDVRLPRGLSPIVLPGCAGDDPSLAPALLASGAQSMHVFPCRTQQQERCATGAEIMEPPRRRVFRAAEFLDATDLPVSRRTLMGLGALAANELPVDAAAPLGTRLAQAYRALGVDPADSLELPAPQLTVSGCQACGVCAKVCPSDALDLSVDGGVATLTQNVDACTGAQACVTSCPYDALQVAGQLTLMDAVESPARQIASFAVAECQRCRAAFPAGEAADGSEKTMCPTCERKSADPFSSWLPPGFTRS